MALAENMSLLKVLSSTDEQFVIPIYQRRYDWTEENVLKLLEDLSTFSLTLSDEQENYPGYYMGNIVTKRLHGVGAQGTLVRHAVVDGQQRLTTTLLIIAALSQLRLTNSALEEELPEMSTYLTASTGGRDAKNAKLKIDRLDDGEILGYIIRNKTLGEEAKKTNIYKNFAFIKNYLSRDKKTAISIYKAIRETLLVRVSLNKNENENHIFETINSDGKSLEAADLIKNYIFFFEHTFFSPEDTGDRLNHEYQMKIEQKVGREEINDFYRHYCCVRSEKKALSNKSPREIYKSFKQVTGEKIETQTGVETVIEDIAEVAQLWNEAHTIAEKSVSGKEHDPALWVYGSVVLQAIKSYFPLLVEMSETFNKGRDFKTTREIYRILAKIIVFSPLSGRPEKNNTRQIPTIVRDYLKTRVTPRADLKNFEEWLAQADIASKTPSLTEMAIYSKTANAYEGEVKKYLRYLLVAHELQLTNADTKVDYRNPTTIEHIMPRKYVEKWFPKITAEQERIIDLRINSLGNLTLLTMKENIRQGNDTWEHKKKLFSEDPYASNKRLAQVKKWDLDAIDQRTEEMIKSLFAFFNG